MRVLDSVCVHYCLLGLLCLIQFTTNALPGYYDLYQNFGKTPMLLGLPHFLEKVILFKTELKNTYIQTHPKSNRIGLNPLFFYGANQVVKTINHIHKTSFFMIHASIQ